MAPDSALYFGYTATEEGADLDARFALVASRTTIINPADAPYNAVLDGVTDDTVAINAALAAGALLGNAVIEIPANKTAVAKDLVINGPLTFRGAGPGAKLLMPADAPATSVILRVNTAYASDTLNDVIVENLEFDGNQTVQTVGILARRCKGLVIEGNRFRNFTSTLFPAPGYCIYVGGWSDGTTTLNHLPPSPVVWTKDTPEGWSSGVRIVDNTFLDCAPDRQAVDDAADANLNENFNLDGRGAESMLLIETDGAYIAGNYTNRAVKGCFVPGWARRIIYIGNIVENCSDSGGRFQSWDDGTHPVTDIHNIDVSHNTFRWCRKDGLRVSGHKVNAVGNTSEYNRLSGIAAVVIVDSKITHSHCHYNRGNGIHLVRTSIPGWGPHRNTVVALNHCYENEGSGIEAVGGGDAYTAAATNMWYYGNYCRGNLFGGIRIFDHDRSAADENRCWENGVYGTSACTGISVLSIYTNGGRVATRGNWCWDTRTGTSLPTQTIGIQYYASGGEVHTNTAAQSVGVTWASSPGTVSLALLGGSGSPASVEFREVIGAADPTDWHAVAEVDGAYENIMALDDAAGSRMEWRVRSAGGTTLVSGTVYYSFLARSLARGNFLGGSETALKTTGSFGSMAPHVLIDNDDTGCTYGVDRVAVGSGKLRLTDVIFGLDATDRYHMITAALRVGRGTGEFTDDAVDDEGFLMTPANQSGGVQIIHQGSGNYAVGGIGTGAVTFGSKLGAAALGSLGIARWFAYATGVLGATGDLIPGNNRAYNIGSAAQQVKGLYYSDALYREGVQILGARMAAIADAVDATDMVTKFNTLLAELRTTGLLIT